MMREMHDVGSRLMTLTDEPARQAIERRLAAVDAHWQRVFTTAKGARSDALSTAKQDYVTALTSVQRTLEDGQLLLSQSVTADNEDLCGYTDALQVCSHSA